MVMKLNLGCGADIRPGYINIDVRRIDARVLRVNLEEELLTFFPDESVEEIVAKDVLEHISWRRVEDLLRDCYRVLKRGGRMYIQVPDLEAIARKIILNPGFKYGELEGWKAISYWVYGAQDYPENTHKTGFTIPTLRKLLESIGFRIVEIGNDGGTNIICTVVKP